MATSPPLTLRKQVMTSDADRGTCSPRKVCWCYEMFFTVTTFVEPDCKNPEEAEPTRLQIVEAALRALASIVADPLHQTGEALSDAQVDCDYRRRLKNCYPGEEPRKNMDRVFWCYGTNFLVKTFVEPDCKNPEDHEPTKLQIIEVAMRDLADGVEFTLDNTGGEEWPYW